MGALARRHAPLAHEAASLKRQIVRGEWSAAQGSNAGSPNHGAFEKNPQIRLTLARPCEVLLRLRCAPPRPKDRPSLLLALFHQGERLTADTARLGRAAATSGGGVYAYPAGGALLPRAQLAAGSYLVVPSTFDRWVGAFELVVCAPDGAVRVERL